MRRKEWGKLKRMERLNEMEEAESLKERIQRRRMETLKRKKPHLFNVPQKHSRSDYCSYLMESDIFPKVKRG